MSEGPRLTSIGRLAILLFMAACAGGAWFLFSRDKGTGSQSVAGLENGGHSSTAAPVTIRIAYGTEKQRWLQWALEEFQKTGQGGNIKVELLPLGSLEGARATINGEKKIHAWSPASSAYKDIFITEWQLKHSSDPILREEPLALSPMVFVCWKERYDAFTARYPSFDFQTISDSLTIEGGWGAIAAKPEWGFFKFGMTDPNTSNSGLLTLMLMAHQYHGKTTPLTLADIVDPGFQSWLRGVGNAVSGLSNSTGNMMREMVLKGPASFDAVVVYENVAIDYLKNAEGRWGALQVAYPAKNIWNDNPFYIINAEWSSPEERKATNTFLDFLLSSRVQKQSLEHGFRPGDPAIAINGPDSPFTKYKANGIHIQIPSICEPPKAEAITNMLTGWQRLRSGK